MSDQASIEVELVPTPKERLESWLPTMWSTYLENLIDAGESEERARRNVEQNKERLFKDGLPVEGQYIFDVRVDGCAVGFLWLGRQDGAETDWFVYDIVIDAEHRGRGIGRSAMLAGENHVKALGATSLALNVFGPNVAARKLYESLGFHVVAQVMKKPFADR